MYFSVLGSGSKGNCLYIESAQTAILIDAGFSGKEISRRLAVHGKELENINGLFLTHEHGDHVQGAGVISRRCKIAVHANAGTFQGSDKKIAKVYKRVEFETGKPVQIQDLIVRSFRISHDTKDPVGFLVSDGKRSIACCTDTGKVSTLISSRLSGCNALVLEFNHDLKMLQKGPYPHSLKQRVRSSQGHLANGDAAEFLHSLLHDGLQHIVLAHLSETNNTPQLALKSVMPHLAPHYQKRLYVAAQQTPTPLFCLSKEV